MRPPRIQGQRCGIACGCLTVALLGFGTLCAPAKAADVAAPVIVVSPSGASSEITPAGTVVLRGAPPQPIPVVPAAPTATLPGPLRLEGWDNTYDTSGIDRRYDTSGLVLRSAPTYDTTGIDRGAGFSR
jgi:hypothetical protein